MAFSRRIEERRQHRDEQRRQRAIERRQEDDRQQVRDAERRAEALAEGQALEASLEEERIRREAVIARARMMRVAERHEGQRKVEHRDRLLDAIRQARQQRAQTAEEQRVRRVELRQQILDARQDALRQTLERKGAARAQEAEEPETPAADAKKRATGSSTRGLAKPGAEEARAPRSGDTPRDQSRGRPPATPDAAQPERDGEARSDDGRAAREAQDERRRQARKEQQEAREAQDAARRADAERARQARLDERKAAAADFDRLREQQESARRERLDERRAADDAARERRERRDALRQEALGDRREPTRQAPARAETRSPRESEKDTESRPAPERPLLVDRIPTGVLSGSLPWLKTAGNQIVTLRGEPVTLRGVSLVGLDGADPDPQAGFAAGAGITPALIDAALEWGVTVIRLAINRGRVLSGAEPWSAFDYLRELDTLIDRTARGGAYTLLSLRRLDEVTAFGTRTTGHGVRVPHDIAPQPDVDSVGMWRLVAERYAQEPAVLFDLYTAPHAPLPDDLTGYDTDWDRWTLWVQLAVADMQLVHPGPLCFVAGLDDGSDFSGFPVPGTAGDPIPGLVYAAHLTPRSPNMESRLRALGRRQPVFVTEWGGRDADIAWGEKTALALSAAGIGWTAAHWNGEPGLVRLDRDRWVPTTFGRVVQRALAITAEDRIARPPAAPAALADL